MYPHAYDTPPPPPQAPVAPPVAPPGQFDPLGGPALTPGIPPAVAARQRKDAKRDEKRKIGGKVLSAMQSAPAAPPAAPKAPPPQNSTSDAVPQPTAIPRENVPQFQPAQYKPPNKGMEYLAAGLSLLFPGAPIARMAAGFMQGQQTGAEQRYDRSEKQAEQQYAGQRDQAAADYQQQIATAKSVDAYNLEKYQAAQGLRAQGIDPATNKPFVLPPNLTRVLPPGMKRAPSASDYLRHETALADFYTGVGATDKAKEHMDLAADYQKQAIDDANNARTLYLTQYRENAEDRRASFSQQEQDRREDSREGAENAREGTREDREDQRQADREAAEDLRSDRRDATTDATKRATLRDEAAKSSADFYGSWNKAIRPPTGQGGVPVPLKDHNGYALTNRDGTSQYAPPAISNVEAQALGKKFSEIDRSSDPVGLAEQYADKTPGLKPVAKQLLLDRGRVADLKRRSAGMPVKPLQGSVRAPSPPHGSNLSPQDVRDFQGADSATQQKILANPQFEHAHPGATQYLRSLTSSSQEGGAPTSPFAQ